MALVDGNYNFIYAHLGTPGKAWDCGVFVNTSLYRPLECGELLAKPVPLPGSAIFVTVADDAFPLAQYMMKQFPNRLQEPLITDFPVQDKS